MDTEDFVAERLAKKLGEHTEYRGCYPSEKYPHDLYAQLKDVVVAVINKE